MNHDINKVISLKMTADETTIEQFNGVFQNVFDATRILFNEIICWGKDTVYTYDGEEKVVDLIAKRKELYELTDKSISQENFDTLLFVLFNYFIACGNNGRDLATSIFGTPRTKEVITDTDFYELKKSAKLLTDDKKRSKELETLKKKINQVYLKIGNTLTKIGFKNREPFINFITFDETYSDEKYSVIANVHRMLTGWIKCDKMAYKKYHEEKTKIAHAKNEFDDGQVKLIEDFVEFCLSPVDPTNKHSCVIKSFDSRIHNHLKHCLIPALQSGMERPKKGFFRNYKEEKIPYSLHPSFYKYLQNNPDLWECKDPFILKSIFLLEMEMSNRKLKDHADYPFMGESSVNRVHYNLGKNYIKYQFSPTGSKVNDKNLEQKQKNDVKKYHFINGIKVDDLTISFRLKIKNSNYNEETDDEDKKDVVSESYDMGIFIKDKYFDGTYNPNPYFKDLVVWTSNNENDCTNLFQFTRRGQTVQALVKEPDIIFNGEYFEIRVSMTVVIDEESDICKNISSYHMTAIPFSRTGRQRCSESDKNKDRFKEIDNCEFNAIAFDLGQRTPYSYAVGKGTVGNPISKFKVIGTGEYEMSDNEMKDIYFNLLNDLKSACKLIGVTKSWKTKLEKAEDFEKKLHPFIIQTIGRAQDFFRNTQHHKNFSARKRNAFEKITNQNIEEIINDLYRIVKNTDLINLKSEYRWIGQYVTRYVHLAFKKVKVMRQFHLSTKKVEMKHDYEFTWLKCIEQLKRVLRSSFYIGTDPDDRPEINLKSLVDYANGVKDNFLKVIASSMVSEALRHNCAVIVIEDLENKRSKMNKRNENFMQSLWSVKRIKTAIENAASWHGIAVAPVSEVCTSQFDFSTGRFGYRNLKDNRLYFKDSKGQLKSVHADINAAQNILSNFFTRHASIRQIGLTKKYDNEEGGKRIKGFLTFHHGSVKKGLEAIKEEVNNLEDVKYAYFHGKKWISDIEKKAMVEEIKNIVKEKEKEKEA